MSDTYEDRRLEAAVNAACEDEGLEQCEQCGYPLEEVGTAWRGQWCECGGEDEESEAT